MYLYRIQKPKIKNKNPLLRKTISVSEFRNMPEIHFTLRPPGKPENSTQFMMPEWYYNVDQSFVIRPKELKNISLCDKHFADTSLCLISTNKACATVVSLQLYNNSLTKKIKIPRKTSLQKLMQYSLISTHSFTVCDKTCSRLTTYIIK
jgi:hypothetical protein